MSNQGRPLYEAIPFLFGLLATREGKSVRWDTARIYASDSKCVQAFLTGVSNIDIDSLETIIFVIPKLKGIKSTKIFSVLNNHLALNNFYKLTKALLLGNDERYDVFIYNRLGADIKLTTFTETHETFENNFKDYLIKNSGKYIIDVNLLPECVDGGVTISMTVPNLIVEAKQCEKD